MRFQQSAFSVFLLTAVTKQCHFASAAASFTSGANFPILRNNHVSASDSNTFRAAPLLDSQDNVYQPLFIRRRSNEKKEGLFSRFMSIGDDEENKNIESNEIEATESKSVLGTSIPSSSNGVADVGGSSVAGTSIPSSGSAFPGNAWNPGGGDVTKASNISNSEKGNPDGTSDTDTNEKTTKDSLNKEQQDDNNSKAKDDKDEEQIRAKRLAEAEEIQRKFEEEAKRARELREAIAKEEEIRKLAKEDEQRKASINTRLVTLQEAAKKEAKDKNTSNATEKGDKSSTILGRNERQQNLPIKEESSSSQPFPSLKSFLTPGSQSPEKDSKTIPKRDDKVFGFGNDITEKGTDGLDKSAKRTVRVKKPVIMNRAEENSWLLKIFGNDEKKKEKSVKKEKMDIEARSMNKLEEIQDSFSKSLDNIQNDFDMKIKEMMQKKKEDRVDVDNLKSTTGERKGNDLNPSQIKSGQGLAKNPTSLQPPKNIEKKVISPDDKKVDVTTVQGRTTFPRKTQVVPTQSQQQTKNIPYVGMPDKDVSPTGRNAPILETSNKPIVAVSSSQSDTRIGSNLDVGGKASIGSKNQSNELLNSDFEMEKKKLQQERDDALQKLQETEKAQKSFEVTISTLKDELRVSMESARKDKDKKFSFYEQEIKRLYSEAEEAKREKGQMQKVLEDERLAAELEKDEMFTAYDEEIKKVQADAEKAKQDPVKERQEKMKIEAQNPAKTIESNKSQPNDAEVEALRKKFAAEKSTLEANMRSLQAVTNQTNALIEKLKADEEKSKQEKNEIQKALNDLRTNSKKDVDVQLKDMKEKFAAEKSTLQANFEAEKSTLEANMRSLQAVTNQTNALIEKLKADEEKSKQEKDEMQKALKDLKLANKKKVDKQLKDMKEKFAAEKSTLEANLASLDVEKNQANSLIEKLQADLKQSEKDRTEMEKAIDELNTSSTKSIDKQIEDSEKKFKAEKKILQTNISSLEKEKNQAEALLQEAKKVQSTSESVITDLQSKLKDALEKVNAKSEQVVLLEERNTEIEKEKKTLKKTVSSLENEKSQLQSKMKTISDAKLEYEKINANLQQELKTALETSSTKSKQTEELNRQLESAKQTLEKEKEEMFMAYDLEINKLKDEAENAKKDMVAAQKSLDDFKVRISEEHDKNIEDMKKKFEKERSALKSNMKALESEKNQGDLMLQEIEAAQAASDSMIADLKSELKDALEKVQSSDMVEQLIATQSTMEETIKDLQKQLTESKKTALEEKTQMQQTFELEIKQIREMADEAEKEKMKMLKEFKEGFDTTLDTLKKQFAEEKAILEAEKKELKSSKAMFDSTVADLQKALDTMEERARTEKNELQRNHDIEMAKMREMLKMEKEDRIARQRDLKEKEDLLLLLKNKDEEKPSRGWVSKKPPVSQERTATAFKRAVAPPPGTLDDESLIAKIPTDYVQVNNENKMDEDIVEEGDFSLEENERKPSRLRRVFSRPKKEKARRSELAEYASDFVEVVSSLVK
ncbi:predicted protein [Chaetoceros tenuissimus]|uniref:Uncharacterized protein n=1 Tax=Chaetoceros tenuissimus TaxID=426638 RepID=A0AAD3CVD7_9STRA|nr:predicted protein [Chaetoceros tenuissimus]